MHLVALAGGDEQLCRREKVQHAGNSVIAAAAAKDANVSYRIRAGYVVNKNN